MFGVLLLAALGAWVLNDLIETNPRLALALVVVVVVLAVTPL